LDQCSLHLIGIIRNVRECAGYSSAACQAGHQADETFPQTGSSSGIVQGSTTMPGRQHMFAAFANRVSDLAGKPGTFMLAFAGVVAWAATGPIFGYSETWQLVINTSTTIITFLMVFILQNTQNRDGKALQAKLDELILTSKAAENSFVGVERLEEQELRQLSQELTERAWSRSTCPRP
jgi:low affinity Fe/Cu permease